jgi:hypothetical protein
MAAPKQVKLAGKLPEGDADGLTAIAGMLRRQGNGAIQYVVVGILAREDLTIKDYTGEIIPKVRFTRLEVITGEDVDGLIQLMRRANDKRVGRITLPLALEDDLAGVFKDWPDDGEATAATGGDEP